MSRTVNPWIIAVTVTLATLMEVLDTSIANVALPHIAGSLGATQHESTWILTSYLVANAVALPVSAYLSALIGRKRFYMICVAIFGLSSVMCGLAPSLPLLLMFRVLQGVGGGGLGPSEQAILADTFPPEKRGQAFALYGVVVVMAPTIGPTIGGWITDNYDWRWIFFIMVSQRQAPLRQKQAAREKTIQNAPRQIQIRNADVAGDQANAASAAAQVRQQQMNLAYCRILAPVSGLVSQRTAEVGARVSIGQQLMLLVQTKDLWVTANFKETQLKKVRVGQRVTIDVDGLDKKFDGYVESLPASTGDRTSALPPENATGNFVKIVQRMPLRIRFRDNQDGLDQLRPGMSVVPKIHLD